MFIRNVVNSDGGSLERSAVRTHKALDPRVTYLVTSMMEDVINRGTGASVRARGFTAPAAGKTGTSHDGWFAGYINDLICVVWVGYDSDLELPLSGASSALPIWTEFMKRAITVPEYSDVSAPEPPPGIVQVEIDPESGELATPHCPTTQTEFFLEGTEPQEYCHLHNLSSVPRALAAPGITRASGAGVSEPTGPAQLPVLPPPAAPPVVPATTATATPPAPTQEKKPGLLRRIFGIFTGGSDTNDAQSRPGTEPSGSR